MEISHEDTKLTRRPSEGTISAGEQTFREAQRTSNVYGCLRTRSPPRHVSGAPREVANLAYFGAASFHG